MQEGFDRLGATAPSHAWADDGAPSTLVWRVEGAEPTEAIRTLDARLIPVGQPAALPLAGGSRQRLVLIVVIPLLAIAAVGALFAGLTGGTERADPVSQPLEIPSVGGSELVQAPSPPPVDLAAVQQQLTDLRYYVGPIDGQPSPSLQSALIAFQRVHDLPADGAASEQTVAALQAPRQPELQGGELDRVEVDLTRQVLYLVNAGQAVRIIPTSSGDGATYETVDGTTGRSLTPVGEYRVQRRIAGERRAPLGTMYDPLYFYRGWAIHGSDWVFSGPASHGCVRTTREDATWLFEHVPVGLQVILYGGTHTFPAGSTAPGTDNPSGDSAPDSGRAPEPPAPRPAPTSPGPPPPQAPAPAPPDPTPPPPEPDPDPLPTLPIPTPTEPTPTPTPSPTSS